MNRVKDPDGNVKSVAFVLGARAEACKNVVIWGKTDS